MFYINKLLGQNFLIDSNLAKTIVSYLSLQSYNFIVEVGPGFGALTKYIIKKCKNVLLIEIDKRLVKYLRNKYSEIYIIHDNFLYWNPKYFNLKEFCLIGNFPYSISSQILFKLISIRNYVPECIGMFQKEVADRIVAKISTKSYSILSVLINAFYNVEYLLTVNKNVFKPKPKITSSLLRFLRKSTFPDCNILIFFNIVKTAFNKRRKILKNSLDSFIFNKEINDNDLFLKRPEELSVNDFIFLTKHVIDYEKVFIWKYFSSKNIK